jgi:hypothetical protein
MNKLIVVLVTIAVTLLMGSVFAPSYAQEAAKEEKPTFYHLVPGTYVNGWPRFTIHYPKDWVEVTPMMQEVFRAKPPGGTNETFAVVVLPFPFYGGTLDKAANIVADFFKGFSVKDVTIITNKLSRLSNGTPAREVELRGTMSGLPFNWLALFVEHGDVWIEPSVSSQSGRIGEHLKAILYSLQYEPTKDEPVKLPPDVQEFFDSLRNAWISHDLAKVMTHFSDRYLNSGVRKGEMERLWKPGSSPFSIDRFRSLEYSITDFVATGDRAYIAGFSNRNGGEIMPLLMTSIIKENGEWKWYGNQRDVSP